MNPGRELARDHRDRPFELPKPVTEAPRSDVVEVTCTAADVLTGGRRSVAAERDRAATVA